MINIIEIFKTYCLAQDIKFVYEPRFTANYVLDYLNLQLDQYVLIMLPYEYAASNIKGVAIGSESFNCFLMLGRKNETAGTQSNLDELFSEKYEARLWDLLQKFFNVCANVACGNELIMSNFTSNFEINAFDSNIDFVYATINFTT